MRIVRSLFPIFVLLFFMSSCRHPRPFYNDFIEYSKYIRDGDLEGVKRYYKKFKKHALQEYGIEGIYIVNPLLGALFFEHYEIARFLISKGADVNAMVSVNAITTEAEKNPIIFSCLVMETLDALQILIDNNVNVNVYESDGHSLLWTAARWGDIKKLELIASRCKDINQLNKDGSTALFGALGSGNLDCVKYLVEKGININAKAEGVYSALYDAIRLEEFEIAKYLILNGAETDIVIDGVSLRDYAKNEKGIDLDELMKP